MLLPQKENRSKPVTTVGILIINNGKVLLVKHSKKAEHLTDTYGFPAGHIGKGETYKESAVRELAEETGLSTTTDSLEQLPTSYRAVIKTKSGDIDMTYTIFKCRSFSGNLKTSSETYPEWVDLTQLSSINLLPNIESAIEEGLSLEKYPQLIKFFTD